MVKICLYLQETPAAISKQQILNVARVPAMGEFIDLGFNLYRVFLVCHNPYHSDYQATIAALKTEWKNCHTLIDQPERR